MSTPPNWTDFRSKHSLAAHFLALPGAAGVGVCGLAAGALAGFVLGIFPSLLTRNEKVLNVTSGTCALIGYIVCGTAAAHHFGGPLSVVTWLSCNVGMIAFGIKSKPRI